MGNHNDEQNDSDVTEILVDGFGSVAFMGGLIRADLLKLVPNAESPKKPTTKAAYRLIMSPQAFLQAANAMNSLVTKLKESGAVKVQESSDAKKKK
ncbi:MAG: hypothetical protein K0U29_03640 [Gammaproteobacteria bacterium]|nr:hypothetical protein [Gammaproteobacteria bacterium]MCH9744005.1 hypothetical protein [Gammaproteobacteria bacterium]